MKLHYYPETDSLYVELKAGPGVETREVSGINLDAGTWSAWISLQGDLATLEEALPVRSYRPPDRPHRR